jgi:peptide chain release factor subunit 1
MPSTDQLSAQLDRLAAFDSGPFPVISLYLNMQPDQRGRDHVDPFLRKELSDRVRTYSADGPERSSLERDAERIRAHVATVEPSANGLAIFACAGASFFEAVPLAAPVVDHTLYISSEPHLYPLARLADDFPRYAVLLADTQQARLFVVAANALREATTVEGTRTRRHKMGGWSQARYQRHVDNFRSQHAREAIDALQRLVTDEALDSIILAGDEVILPLLRAEMPKTIADRVVDALKLDIRAPEREILDASAALIRQRDATNDRERVDALFDAYRGSGLGVVGVADTSRALELGQVEELLITGTPEAIDVGSAATDAAGGERSAEERAADDLIARARRTSARVTIIQDAALLAPVGGVGALLRFRL